MEFNFKKVLRITADVILAKGYSDAMGKVYIDTFDDIARDYPEFGNCSSHQEILKLVNDEVDRVYPLKAFPYREIGSVDLYVRDETDHEYLKFSETMLI